MRLDYFKCEMCSKEASSEIQLRKENWLRIHGGTLAGINVWLKVPRNAGGSYMLHVGYQEKDYDFCSIECLTKALEGTESM